MTTTGSQRARRRRNADRIVEGITIVLILAMAWWVHGVANDLRHETSSRGHQHAIDLVGACRLDSRRNASDINLNWIYYQSESDLAHEHVDLKRLRDLFAALPATDRAVFVALLSAGDPSRDILQVRADADYNTAWVKTKTVDYHDAVLIHRHTPLGSGQAPYKWVLQNHYSCTKAFR